MENTIKIPEKFINRMKKLLGDEYNSFHTEITEGVSTRSLFINTEKTDIVSFKEIFKEKLSPTQFCENGFYFESESIGKTPLHHAGAIYVQDPSAMSTVCSVEIEKGSKILDMCASPGGKTLLAALKTGTDGLVVANEYSVSRCKTLVGNIERFGLSNVICTNANAAEDSFLADNFKEKFDLIIADCPCSGEGMFRKYPEQAISEWSQENIDKCAIRQAKILDNAALCVKNGGKIIYSTCTFSLEENEITIDAFLKRHKNFSLIPVTEEVGKITVDGYFFDGCSTENIFLSRRFYPHKSIGEGQFIAVLQKNDFSEEIQEMKNKREKKTSLLPLSKEEKSALEKLFKK